MSALTRNNVQTRSLLRDCRRWGDGETKECGMTQRPPQAALRVPFVACALACSERRTESRCSLRRLCTEASRSHSPRQRSSPRMLN